jgi:aryl-alcohol dehydrogenase-like predicted oxidoreductase
MGLGGGWEANVQLTKVNERQARKFLDAAEEIGANFFDHANIYGRGRAEESFGRVLKERPSLRDKIVIQSKCGTAGRTIRPEPSPSSQPSGLKEMPSSSALEM